jgi:cell division protein FtsW (lipid II flippase)
MEIDAQTKLSLAFALLALVLGLAVDLVLNQPDWVAFVVVLVVGLGVPRLLARR